MSRIVYRFRQLVWELQAGPLSSSAETEIRQLLPPALFNLFSTQSASDQWHSYAVMNTLRHAGHEETTLLQAALLHDVGKSMAQLTAIDRSLVVLGSKLAPARAKAWGTEIERLPAKSKMRWGWRTGFISKRHHALWGAELAAQAGADAEVVRLIRSHQDKIAGDDPILRALQAADDLH